MMRSVSIMMSLFTIGVSAGIEMFYKDRPVPSKATGTQVSGQSKTGIPFFRSDTTSRENSRVWLDLPEARIQNFPPTYAGGFYDITTANSYTTPKDAQVQYVCPPNAGPCEVAIFIYECSPCPSQKQGLQQFLIQERGYERTRCAPTFTLGNNPTHHRMTAFVKSIPEDTIETIILPNSVDFIAFGMSNGERPPCSSFNNEMGCSNTDLRCGWKGDSCVLTKCIQQGPSLGGCDTNTCAHKQLSFP